jgi:hypothetical protein
MIHFSSECYVPLPDMESCLETLSDCNLSLLSVGFIVCESSRKDVLICDPANSEVMLLARRVGGRLLA